MSVLELPRADKPSTLKGCVDTLTDGYVRTSTLPRVPTKQSAQPSGKRLPPNLGIPVLIPTLREVIGPAMARHIGLRLSRHFSPHRLWYCSRMKKQYQGIR
jgi:hypothetical protein